jgi:uncharacterized protein
MGFLLRLVFIGIIAWIIIRFIQRHLGKYLAAPPADAQASSNQSLQTHIMRPCALCQVHIPEGESTQSRGYFFCCEAHRNDFFREQV